MNRYVKRVLTVIAVSSAMMIPTADARPWTRQNYLTCQVTLVLSGNYFMCQTRKGNEYLIKMADIEAPELDQYYGKESRNCLKSIISGKKISIKVRDVTSKHVVGELFFQRQNINREMIRQGYAWADRNNPSSIYLRIERDAHSYGFGLWEDVDAVYPADYRKENPVSIAALKQKALKLDGIKTKVLPAESSPAFVEEENDLRDQITKNGDLPPIGPTEKKARQNQ